MKRIKLFLVLGVLAMLLVIPSIAFAGGKPEGKAPQPGAEKYKIAVSMSYIGNQWQGVSRNIILAMAELNYKDKVSDVDVYVAGTDASNQNRQIMQMIAAGYDAIICYPISPTALNSSIQKAVDAGVVFFTYDSVVTSPDAYKVTFDNYGAGKKAAEWLAEEMNYKGNVVLDNGVPGTTVDEDRTRGAKEVFSKYPDIEIVAEFWGMWATGPSGEGMAKVLASNVKVDGVWTQGGTPGVIKAMQDAEVPLCPMAGESANQYRLWLMDPEMKKKGLTGCSYASPLWQGAACLYYAIKILDGDKSVPHLIVVPFGWATSDTLKLAKTGSTEELAAGANVFPAEFVPPGLYPEIYNSKYTPGLDLNMALTGTVPVTKTSR